MIDLFEKTYGTYFTRLTIRLSPCPLREAIVEVKGGTLGVDEIQQLVDDLNSVLIFIRTNDNPWENTYE